MSIEILSAIFYFSFSAEVVEEFKKGIPENARAGKNLLGLRTYVAFIFWLYKCTRLQFVIGVTLTGLEFYVKIPGEGKECAENEWFERRLFMTFIGKPYLGYVHTYMFSNLYVFI